MLSGSKVLQSIQCFTDRAETVSNLYLLIPGLLSCIQCELHFNVSNILKIDFYKTHTLKLFAGKKKGKTKQKIKSHS